MKESRKSSSSTRKPDSVRAQKVYKKLAEEDGIVVRYRGNEPGYQGCPRITVRTGEENTYSRRQNWCILLLERQKSASGRL